jgi:3-deoxy-D-manno-octulosonic-acid transferase|tara:strand:- start:2109 stop:3392 length:1284 start_codon:yes stop_codon:yes gene_type:complete
MILKIYLFLSNFTLPIWWIFLRYRIKKGKEDPNRFVEKLGFITRKRPEGKILWFHALSLGESLALMTMLERLGKALPNAHFLITTSTYSSAKALEKIGLPPRVIHQYLPVDARQSVNSFLKHWKPSLAAVTEFDLWPRALTEVRKRNIPSILINCRITDRSFEKHRKNTNFISLVLALFDQYLTQEKTSRERLIALGAPAHLVQEIGPLKIGADPLPDLRVERIAFTKALGKRKIWLAASTHLLETPMLFDTHLLVCKKINGSLLVLIPRNINDSAQLQTIAKERSLNVVLRSSGHLPNVSTDIYIADTFGEMGLWYRVSAVTFIGHSLAVPGTILTGKNPFEALALGQMVLHGKNFRNFTKIYEMLLEKRASRAVLDSVELADVLCKILNDKKFRTPYLKAAKAIISEGDVSIKQTTKILSELILE